MNITIECVQCEADFELETANLIRNPTLVVCPNCGAKADAELVETAMTALDEFFTQLARLQRRFRVGFSVEPDELADELDEQYTSDDDETLWSDEPEESDDEE
jgi:hypothetical protein